MNSPDNSTYSQDRPGCCKVILTNLGKTREIFELTLQDLQSQNVISRIWAHDYTVWKDKPDEIANRLGWLHCPEWVPEKLHLLRALARGLVNEGYSKVLLLGMGGSSLAPEVFRKTFGVKPGFLELAVLDSTSAEAVLMQERQLDYSKTVFLVSTKSGGTVETFSFFRYFYNRTIEILGKEQAGQHFIAVTDPGSALAEIGTQLNFRAVFLNDPNIGGRFSALSLFGLVPAALLGVNLEELIQHAVLGVRNCREEVLFPSCKNPGAFLGALIGVMSRAGRDKLTFILSPSMTSFGDWLEQLVAESTGKEGQGILPIVGEPIAPPHLYKDDRLFVYLRATSDPYAPEVSALEAAGHPLVSIELDTPYGLGEQFFIWEMATVIAGRILGINPFDQPDVESAKASARQMVAAYQRNGCLSAEQHAFKESGILVFTSLTACTLRDVLNQFLATAEPGAYVAIQAYLSPGAEADAALQALRKKIRDRTRMAVTLGYGPRYLHSTGQLHKGDAGKGLFIQITNQSREDLAIPDKAGEPASSMRFNVLLAAQALGDQQALLAARRTIIRFHLEGNPNPGLQCLQDSL